MVKAHYSEPLVNENTMFYTVNPPQRFQ